MMDSGGLGLTSMSPFHSSMLVGAGTLHERDLVSNPADVWGNVWGSRAARLSRYALNWAHYEGNIFRGVHPWSRSLKSEFDLYPSIRTIFGPAYRGGEFWAEHLFGGTLDAEAGDGTKVPSAIPILIGPRGEPGRPAAAPQADTEEARRLRGCIARLWRDSNFQAAKDQLTRFGAVLGDVALQAYDDGARGRVYLRPWHPRTIATLDRDPQGNVKGYEREDVRADPRGTGTNVLYRETATRVRGRIEYRTFLDDEPYDWRTYQEGDRRIGDTWTENYDFVPLVFIQHRDMGLGWGWSEYHPAWGKLLELDDQASKVADWIRKAVDAPWLIAGVAADQVEVRYTLGSDEDTSEDPYRTRVPIVYATDPQAKAYPLLAPLSIAESTNWILKILAELERDHQELLGDLATASGDSSGRALRVARERVEAKVVARRAVYDGPLVRAQQMAISIGAIKGYEGYEGYDADSFRDGRLDHAIGPRPVFAMTQMDRIEEQQARANVETVRSATLAGLRTAGVPLLSAMRLAGYPEADVQAVAAEARQEAAKALRAARAARLAGVTGVASNGDGGPPVPPAVSAAQGGGSIAGSPPVRRAAAGRA